MRPEPPRDRRGARCCETRQPGAAARPAQIARRRRPSWRCASGRPTTTRASPSNPTAAGQTTQTFVAEQPARLAVDIEGIDLNPALRELVAKVQARRPEHHRHPRRAERAARGAPGDRPQAAGGAAGVHACRRWPPTSTGWCSTCIRRRHATLLELIDRRSSKPSAPPRSRRAMRSANSSARSIGRRAGARAVAAAPSPQVAPRGSHAAASRLDRRCRVRRGLPPPAPKPPLAAAATRRTPPAGATSGDAGRRTAPTAATHRPPDHRGARPGPRRRGPGRHRPGRHAREGRGAADRTALRDRINASVNGNDARLPHARRRLLRAAARARAEGAARAGRPVRRASMPTPSSRRRRSGASVFALSQNGASSSAARWMADKENTADLVGGVNVGGQGCRGAARPARHEHDGADQRQPASSAARCSGEIGKRRPAAQAARRAGRLRGAEGARHPSVLVETAFISNPEEEAKLRDRVPEAAGRCADARHPALLRAQSAAGAQQRTACDRQARPWRRLRRRHAGSGYARWPRRRPARSRRRQQRAAPAPGSGPR